MKTVEYITQLILDGEIEQARREIWAVQDFALITSTTSALNDLETRDLLEAILEAQLTAYSNVANSHF